MLNCMVNLLIQVCTKSLGTAKAGQTATSLISCPALLSRFAKVTTWHHCMYMQNTTALQAQKSRGKPPDTLGGWRSR